MARELTPTIAAKFAVMPLIRRLPLLAQGLSKRECADWCSARGLVVESESKVDFAPRRYTVSYIFEKLPVARLVALTDQLVSDEEDEKEWLLWITDYGIWDDHTEEVGQRLIDTLLRGIGLKTPLAKRQGVILGAADARIMALAVAVIGWDAYVIPQHAKYFLFFHHHGVASLVSSSRHLAERARREISAYDGRIYDAHPLDGPA